MLIRRARPIVLEDEVIYNRALNTFNRHFRER